jgi:hypothetical protein
LFELVNETVFEVEFAKSAGVGNLLIDDLFDVSGLYFGDVGAHGYAFVVDSLLVDSGREKDIEGGVDYLLGLQTLHGHHL